MPRRESISVYRREGETVAQTLERLRQVVKDADRNALVAALRNTAVGRTVLAKAISTFGSRTSAITWITNGAVALNGYRPADFLSSEQGTRQVLDYLDRLEHGIYS